MKPIISAAIFFTICLLHSNNLANGLSTPGDVDAPGYIENKGQWHSDALFLLRSSSGSNLWIDKSGMTLEYYRFTPFRQYSSSNSEPLSELLAKGSIPALFTRHAVKIRYINAEYNGRVNARERQSTYHNYFIGSSWAANAGLFSEVLRDELYDGISVRYYTENGNPRFDYIIEPGADPGLIGFTVEGSNNVTVTEDNELMIGTIFGDILIGDVFAYQEHAGGEREEIECAYIMNVDGKVSLSIGEYDKKRKLIIDPLIYSSFLGGADADVGSAMQLDNSGNSIIVGNTYSPLYPVNAGAFDTSYTALGDVFITKVNAEGTGIIFSTFFGGSDSEWATDLKLDGSGNIYFTGWTKSSDFPVSAGAFSQTFNDGLDAYAAKLSSDGSSLIYSTFIGGSGSDWSSSIILSNSNEAVITGYTNSDDFPVTGSAFSQTLSGSADMFAARINDAGSGLVFATFIGGTAYDEGRAVGITGNGKYIIAGKTQSYDFPVTSNAFDDSLGGTADGCYVILSSDGSSIDYATFLGGSEDDRAMALAFNSNGEIIITGSTSSADFPVSDTTQSDSAYAFSNIFLTKVNASDSTLIFSRIIGGNGGDFPGDIMVDADDNIHLTGITASDNFPVTKGVYDVDFNGGDDVFYTVVEPDGAFLLYSTYLGGTASEEGRGVGINPDGDIVLAGLTASANFPVSDSAMGRIYYGGFFDVFLAKFSIALSDVDSDYNAILPNDLRLYQNYPNPFNPSTVITFDLPSDAWVSLRIYNILGQSVASLVEEFLTAGSYKYTFNAEGLAGGVYFYRLESGKFSAVNKMLLLR